MSATTVPIQTSSPNTPILDTWNPTTLAYDMVLDVTSIVEVGKPFTGWPLEFPPQVQQAIETEMSNSTKDNSSETIKLEVKDEKIISDKIFPGKIQSKVAFVGFFNRGKSYILNKVASASENDRLPYGSAVTTRGVSFKRFSTDTQNTLYIDTAGTNSPISLQLKKFCKEELIKRGEISTLIDDKLEPPSHLTATEQEKWSSEKTVVINEMKKKVRERTLVTKKATENILQDIEFGLADILVYVVNEITWNDQQAIQALTNMMDPKNTGKALRKKTNLRNLVVIHNFKEVSDSKELDKMITKYVTDIYKQSISIKEVVGPTGEVIKCKVFENTTEKLLHLFLAKEGSEAGNHQNPATFGYLQTLIRVSTGSENREDSFLTEFRKLCHHKLDEYFKDFNDSGLYYDRKTKKLLFRLENRNLNNKDHVGDVKSVNENAPLRLIRDKLEFDGIVMKLGSKNLFNPPMLVMSREEGLYIFLEIAGQLPKDHPALKTETNSITPSSSTTNNNNTKNGKTEGKPDELKPSYRLRLGYTRRNEQFSISGKRVLYFFRVAGGSSPSINSGSMTPYLKDLLSRDMNSLSERKEGEFDRNLKIAWEIDEMRPIQESVYYENGIAHIFIPRVVEDQ